MKSGKRSILPKMLYLHFMMMPVRHPFSDFAHAGHITKEDAREISGLPHDDFDNVYTKASNIAEKVMQHEGNKMDKFLEHFSQEIDEYVAKFGTKFFM
jgi:hypothetical protein